MLNTAPSQSVAPFEDEVSSACCVIRCVDGLHRGALARCRSAATLGSAEDNDIILRDPGVRAHHAELRRVDGRWLIFDAQNGNPLPVIESRRGVRSERRLHALGSAQLVLSQVLSAKERVTGAPNGRGVSRQWRFVPLMLVGLSGLMGASVVVHLVQPAEARLQSGQRNLAVEGFPDVQWLALPGAAAELSGYVDDAHARQRLEAWLARQNSRAVLSHVRVGTELVSRVREGLRTPSLAVSYQGAGRVLVKGETDSKAVQERLQRLHDDLAGVVQIDNQTTLVARQSARREHRLPVKVQDVRTGVAGSFSDGEGARYFVGGVLPDGAEVVAIGADQIEFALGETRIIFPLKK